MKDKFVSTGAFSRGLTWRGNFVRIRKKLGKHLEFNYIEFEIFFTILGDEVFLFCRLFSLGSLSDRRGVIYMTWMSPIKAISVSLEMVIRVTSPFVQETSSFIHAARLFFKKQNVWESRKELWSRFSPLLVFIVAQMGGVKSFMFKWALTRLK